MAWAKIDRVTLTDAALGWTGDDLVTYANQWAYPLDIGIARAVRVLRDAGLTTVESCQGGEGHSYPEPTVKFEGTPACGWRAVTALMDHGLPVSELRLAWTFEFDQPHGPTWMVTFSRQLD